MRSLKPILLVAFLSCTSARAQSIEPASEEERRQAAHQHFGRGLTLASQYSYVQALQEFGEAYRLRPHFAVLYNIGQACIALGQPVEAIAALERYLAEGKEQIPTERVEETTSQIAAEKALIAVVVLAVKPAGAAIQIDGRELGNAPLPDAVPVAAGKHVVSVSTADGTQLSRPISLQGGEQLNLTLDIPAAAASTATPSAAADPSRAQLLAQSSSELNASGPNIATAAGPSIRVSTLGYALGIAGVALGGAAFGDYLWNRHRFQQWQSTHAELQANQQAPDYPQRQSANNELAGSIQSASHVTVGLVVASGLLTATGITLVLLGRSQRPSLVVNSRDQGMLLSLRGSW